MKGYKVELLFWCKSKFKSGKEQRSDFFFFFLSYQ